MHERFVLNSYTQHHLADTWIGTGTGKFQGEGEASKSLVSNVLSDM